MARLTTTILLTIQDEDDNVANLQQDGRIIGETLRSLIVKELTDKGGYSILEVEVSVEC